MSNPPEDSCFRPSKAHRKEKIIVRVGDDTDGREGNFTNSRHDSRRSNMPPSSCRPSSNIQMQSTRKKSKQERDPVPFSFQSNLSPVLDSATLASIASESVQNAVAAMNLPSGEERECSTVANPLVLRSHDMVQTGNPSSIISDSVSPFQSPNSGNSGWLVPMDSVFLQGNQLE